MRARHRFLTALVVGLVAALASSTLVAAPAAAATVNITVSADRINNAYMVYPSGLFDVGVNATTLQVTLPVETVDMNLAALTWQLMTTSGSAGAKVVAPANTFTIPIPAGLLIVSSTVDLLVYIGGQDGPYFSEARDELRLTATLNVIGSSATTVPMAFTSAAATEFDLGRELAFSGPQDNVRVNWGDSLVFTGSGADFWTKGPDNWASSYLQVSLDSADLSSEGGFQLILNAPSTISPNGSTLTVPLPATAPAAVNWSTDTYLRVALFLSPSFHASNRLDLPLNFHPTNRLAGGDRFNTARRVAEEFEYADVVYIANGRNYPDALSAAPAAAHQGGPLLLTEQASLPYATQQELLRLQPPTIVIAGGTSVVSSAVEAALNALPFAPTVIRKAGADRYETSREVTAYAFESAANAFIATGSNFPDALAASAAAAHVGAPVVLVPGTSAAVDGPTLDLFTSLGVSDVFIAGGTGVVSTAIETQLKGIYGPSHVVRKAGEGRYSTAVDINTLFTDPTTNAYLAVGTGYADALAGAALAGANDSPLFTVPGTCVPQIVLDALGAHGVTTVTLLGGIGVLNTSVGNLSAC